MKKRLRKIILGLLLLGLVAGLGVAGYVFAMVQDAPTVTKNDLSSDNSTKFYDKDGKVIWVSSSTTRDYVANKDIPQAYKDAVVSVEDKNFYHEHGFSITGMLMAALSNVFGSGDGLRGGSTITQQLVKLSKFSTKASDQTIKRKIQELWLSLQVDATFSKDQILEYYINKVYEGHQVYGAQTIAHYYYGKDLKQLNLSQMATIAGIGQAPAVYDLYTNAKVTEERRNIVLSAMLKNKKISKSDYNKAIKTNIKQDLRPKNSQEDQNDNNARVYGAYITEVKAQLKKLGYDYENGGLEVHTNVDPKVQQTVYDTLNNSASFPNDTVQAAATVVDPNNGNIVAQVGSRKDTGLYGYNQATSDDRSSGSGIKPLLDYGPAIEYLNWATNHLVADTPFTYSNGTQLYDWDSLYQGNITMHKALSGSRNITAVRALQAVGMARAQSFLNKLGINDQPVKDESQAISYYTSTDKLANAFATIANGGTYHTSNYVNNVVTPDNVKHAVSSDSHRAMRASTAFMLTSMLKDVISPTGTAPEAIINGLHQAGKSGLNGYASGANVPDRAIQDAWMNGYTKSYAISVWTGYKSPNQPGNYLTWDQQGLPEEVYQQIMSQIMANKPNTDWTKPDTVKSLGNDEYAATDGGTTVEDDQPAMVPSINDASSIANEWQGGGQ
ncbi:MAG TPA: transglycosylase domain-containing protein [Lactobacillaceae bacterium]|jgi:penicillin-binding protein 1A